MKFSLALTACLAAATFAPAADKAVGVGPLDLLKDLHATAWDAAVHASTLKSVNRAANPDWRTESVELGALKSDMNKMALTVARLEHFRGVATADEQKTIDAAIPLLEAMAKDTRAAVQFINEKQADFWLPAYQQLVSNLERESAQLSSSLGQYIKLAKARGQEERLEKELGAEAGR